ncbi:MAG: toll/interleukin-1 receptor domain-containing protein, partial [Nitrosomonadales bacterium]|nr:toll/interleukin-1 receptor domain-containing protein [Nitrosomonadales bacterium]
MDKTVVTSKPRNLIFISHATPDDNGFTSWLSARLASDGYEVWSDLTQLVGGEVFWKDIDEAIRNYSIKFLSVLSPVSVGKRGFKKELSVADAVEAKGMLGDFIIPLRIGGIPYDEIPIDIHNKNVIDFTKGWHIGLAQLLEKLEKDHVPRKENFEFALSNWAKGFLEIDKLLENKEEEVISNWLPIFEMPASIKISYFDSAPPNIDFLKRQWPCRQIENSVISFADAKDF